MMWSNCSTYINLQIYLYVQQPNSPQIKRIQNLLHEEELILLKEITSSCELASTLLPVKTVGVQVSTLTLSLLL